MTPQATRLVWVTGAGPGGDEPDPNADDDGDGFTNAEEEEAGTNPDYAYSRPYEGGYNVGFCDTPPTPTGPSGTASITQDGTTYEWPSLAMGDVPNNGLHADRVRRDGRPLQLLRQARDGARQCRLVRALPAKPRDRGPEHSGRASARRRTADHRAHYLGQWGQCPDLAFVQDWADEYSFDDVPVLAVPGPPTSYDPRFLFDCRTATSSVCTQTRSSRW